MKRVLLVDDDPDILDSLTLLLEANYAVTPAEDGAIALELLGQHEFDVVVLDLMMPVLNGTRVLAELRQRGIHIPVILISAHRDLDRQVLQHQQLGAFASLRKPFDIRELERRLEAALRQGGKGGASGSGGTGNGPLPPPGSPVPGGGSHQKGMPAFGAQGINAGGWPSSTHRLVVSSQKMGNAGSIDRLGRGCLQRLGSRTVWPFSWRSHLKAGNTPTASYVAVQSPSE
ncbi:response regulator [Archangium violaceum]|nr:response regulator [Archangium violaceum]